MSAKRIISWTELLPGGEDVVEGEICRFVSGVACLQPKSRLPPYRVFCDILSRGIIDGGMGGGLAWNIEEVVLTEKEYRDCVLQLFRSHEQPQCTSVSLEEWIAWCAHVDCGVDYGRHLELLNALREAGLNKGTPADPDGFAYLSAVSSYVAFRTGEI